MKRLLEVYTKRFNIRHKLCAGIKTCFPCLNSENRHWPGTTDLRLSPNS